jgi:hypothetical protein
MIAMRCPAMFFGFYVLLWGNSNTGYPYRQAVFDAKSEFLCERRGFAG